MVHKENKKGAILVVGGGVAGITAAVEAAEVGSRCIWLRRSPSSAGGRYA